MTSGPVIGSPVAPASAVRAGIGSVGRRRLVRRRRGRFGRWLGRLRVGLGVGLGVGFGVGFGVGLGSGAMPQVDDFDGLRSGPSPGSGIVSKRLARPHARRREQLGAAFAGSP